MYHRIRHRFSDSLSSWIQMNILFFTFYDGHLIYDRMFCHIYMYDLKYTQNKAVHLFTRTNCVRKKNINSVYNSVHDSGFFLNNPAISTCHIDLAINCTPNITLKSCQQKRGHMRIGWWALWPWHFFSFLASISIGGMFAENEILVNTFKKYNNKNNNT